MNIAKVLLLEVYKFRHYKPFLVILGLYGFCFLASGLMIKRILDWILAETQNEELLKYFLGAGLPLFDFVDIWQNLGWLAAIFRWIPALMIILSITVEYEQRTLKQNIIDGLTRQEYLASKLGLVSAISVASALLLLILGIILGLWYSPVRSLPYILVHIEFVAAYGLEVFAFLCMAMFLAFFIRRSGVAIILFLLYTVFMEPIGTAFLYYQFDLPVWFFPVEAINLIIQVPFQKYWLSFVEDELVPRDLLMAGIWSVVFIFLSAWLLKRRDL